MALNRFIAPHRVISTTIIFTITNFTCNKLKSKVNNWLYKNSNGRAWIACILHRNTLLLNCMYLRQHLAIGGVVRSEHPFSLTPHTFGSWFRFIITAAHLLCGTPNMWSGEFFWLADWRKTKRTHGWITAEYRHRECPNCCSWYRLFLFLLSHDFSEKNKVFCHPKDERLTGK